MSTLYVVPRARRALARLVRRLAGIERRLISLPAAPGEPIGRVLLSYVVDPFLAAGEAAVSYAHTQDWECWAIAKSWRELGFAVDVIHWTNSTFVPKATYDVLIDPRRNLERLAALLPEATIKIFHAETAHWRVNDEAQRQRLDELRRRRGIRLQRTRLVGANRGIEVADCAVVLGNEWTLATYSAFGKPLCRVPLSNPLLYPWPEAKDFDACRNRFLWFGGVGFVHKGLDLVLDAFAGADELELEVAAPLDREPEFAAAYQRELFRTPNIRALGWLDVAAQRFVDVADRVVGAVYPSCSEGGGGSLITTMHAGLVPLATREASVDVDPSYGVLLTDARVETVRASCRALAQRPAEELRATAAAAWRRARAAHTRETFAARYRQAVLEILARFRPELAERCRS